MTETQYKRIHEKLRQAYYENHSITKEMHDKYHAALHLIYEKELIESELKEDFWHIEEDTNIRILRSNEINIILTGLPSKTALLAWDS